MADASRVMLQEGNQTRGERYRQSHQAALRYMNRLTVRSEDTFCMPAPARALGGVRRSLNRSEMPLEAAAYLLLALLARRRPSR